MTECEVLDHKTEQFDLVVEVLEAEKIGEEDYHLIAPKGILCGTLTKYGGEWEFHSTVESNGDRIHCYLPDQVVEGFLERVKVIEK